MTTLRPITATLSECMRLFGFGKNKMLEIAHNADAVIEINCRCKRYKVEKIESYLDSLGGGQ